MRSVESILRHYDQVFAMIMIVFFPVSKLFANANPSVRHIDDTGGDIPVRWNSARSTGTTETTGRFRLSGSVVMSGISHPLAYAQPLRRIRNDVVYVLSLKRKRSR